MEDKVLLNIWNHLTSEGLTSSDFETWYENVNSDEEIQKNVHSYLSENNLTDSNFEQWSLNAGLKKKQDLDETFSSKYIPKFVTTGNAFIDPVINSFSQPLIGFLAENIEQGIARGQTSDEALSILMNASDASEKQVEDYVNSVISLEKYKPSEAMIRFNEKYEEEGGDTAAFLSAFAQNPSIGSEVLIQSISGAASTAFTKEGAAITAAGAATGAAVGAAVGPLGVVSSGLYTGIAAANGAMEVASSLTEFIKEDFDDRNLEFNAENVRELLSDEERFGDIRMKAIARGGIISAIDLATMGLAGKATKVGTKLSRGLGTKASKAIGATSGIITEGAGGSTGEALARVATGQEMSAAEIGLEGIAGTATAPITIGRAMSEPKYKIGNDVVSGSDITEVARKNPEMLRGKSVTIENDEVLEKEVKDIKEREELKEELEGIMPAESIEEAIDLEIERKKLLKSDKYTSKKRIADIESRLDELRTPVEMSLEEKRTKPSFAPPSEEKQQELSIEQKIQNFARKVAVEGKDNFTEDEDIFYAEYSEEIDAAITESKKNIKRDQSRIRSLAQKIYSGEKKYTDQEIDLYSQYQEEVNNQLESISTTQRSKTKEVAYTLPEDPKEAKKDFEVLDNRDGAQGLEIEEDGSGKWVVVNKKTGKIVNSKTKKDAEFLATKDGAANWDYGEGDVIEVEAEPVIGSSEAKNIIESLKRKRDKETVDVYSSLKAQLRLEAKAAREKKYSMDEARKNLAKRISEFVKSGNISTRISDALQKRISFVNLDNPISVQKVIMYAKKVFDNADNAEKISQANSNKKKIKKLNKKGKVDALVYEQAKNFLNIDISLVEDIDEYNRMSEMLRKGLTPTKLSKQGVRVSEDVNLSELKEYNEKQTAIQKEIVDQAFVELYQDATGDMSESLSYEEMQEILNDDEYTPPSSEEAQKLQRDGIKRAYDRYIAVIKDIVEFGKDPFTGERVDIPLKTKETIRSLYEIDLSRYDIKEAIKVLDGLKNFATNYSAGGIQRIAEINKGDVNAKKDAESGVRANKIKLFSSKRIGEFYGQFVFNLGILTEFMFGGERKSRIFFKNSGLSRIKKGKADARTEAKDLEKTYVKRFSKKTANGKSFDNEYNSIERYQLAFTKRTVDGTQEEQVSEFQRRKAIVREDFEYKISQGGVLAKEGQVAKEVYEKILQDSTSPEDVSNKVDSVNKEAVDFWVDVWGDKFDDLSNVSLNVYNNVLVKDKNYTPDKYKKLDESEDSYEIDDLIKKQSYSDPANKVYDKKSKTLIETKRPKSLRGSGMVLDYNFDNGNIRAYENALVDINTADGISQLYGYINSPSFSDIVQNTSDANLLKKRIVTYVRKTRGADYAAVQNQDKPGMRFINRIASVGVFRALGGLAQPIKQTIPPLLNTFINARFNLSVGSFFQDGVQDFIDRASGSIALRGLESTTNIDSPSSKFDYQMKSTKLGQVSKSAGKAVERMTNFGLKYLVQYPDRFAARLSFYTYYRKYLADQGFNVNNIDWSNHKINQDASEYAISQVDRQQNVSDTDMQGEIYSSKSPGMTLFRKTIIPFTNFAMNQKSRMYSDANTLFFQESVSKEDKAAAMRSLSGLVVETAAFNAIGYYVSSILYSMVASMMGKDETEEEKKKRFSNALKGRLTNITNDVLSPFSGITDPIVVGTVNQMLEFISEDDEKAFQLYAQDEKSFLEQIGLLGIGFDVGGQLFDIASMINSGSYTNNYGKEIKLSEDAIEVLKVAFAAQLTYFSGIVPAEVGSMSRYAVREAKKMTVKKRSKPLFRN